MSPEADSLDQPAYEHVGSHLAHGPGRRAVELQELPDAIAGLGRDLRALERGLQRGDHVELATPGDRRAASEVDRAQLHRRPAEGADRRGGVGGIGQESKPGDHVAHLRALEEGAGAAQPVGNATFLERGGHRPRRASAARNRHADLLHLHLARGEGALDVASHGLGLCALVRPGPEANPSRRSGRSARNVGTAGRGRHHRVRRVEQVAAVAPGGLQCDLARLDRLPRPGRGGIAGPPALLVVAGEDGGGRAARQRLDQRPLGGTGVLELVDQQMREALGDRSCQRRPLAEQPGQLEHGVDVVHGARRVEHRVVALVDLGELPLPGGGIPLGTRSTRLLVGPAAEALGRHAGGLQRVDSVDDPGEEPGGVTADLMTSQWQLVDAVEQHRQALGGAE